VQGKSGDRRAVGGPYAPTRVRTIHDPQVGIIQIEEDAPERVLRIGRDARLAFDDRQPIPFIWRERR
jgi:hypothetical protein